MSKQQNLFSRTAREPIHKRSSVLLRAEGYERDNREIAALVLAKPDKHITGLVEWAKLVEAKQRLESGSEAA